MRRDAGAQGREMRRGSGEGRRWARANERRKEEQDFSLSLSLPTSPAYFGHESVKLGLQLLQLGVIARCRRHGRLGLSRLSLGRNRQADTLT